MQELHTVSHMQALKCLFLPVGRRFLSSGSVLYSSFGIYRVLRDRPGCDYQAESGGSRL